MHIKDNDGYSEINVGFKSVEKPNKEADTPLSYETMYNNECKECEQLHERIVKLRETLNKERKEAEDNYSRFWQEVDELKEDISVKDSVIVKLSTELYHYKPME